MLYKTKPENFNPSFEAVGCIVEESNEILLLLRQDHKAQGNTFRIPSGKIEKEEEKLNAVLREIKEETGMELQESKLNCLGEYYVKFQEYDFIYHLFFVKLNQRPEININNDEHKEHLWIDPSKAIDVKLIEDLDRCLEIAYDAL